MPKIQVNERDLSWYSQRRDPGQLTVLMPGIATFGPHKPTLVDSSNFIKTFGDTAIRFDRSYQMAASFIKSGINVLFWRQELDGEAQASATVTGESSNSITFKAKYTGSFSNRMSLTYKTMPGNKSQKLVTVLKDGNPLEQLVISFDPENVQYYQIALKNSNYLSEEVEIAGDDTSKISDTKTAVKFMGGLDIGTAPTDTDNLTSTVVTALESAIDAEEIFSELSDLYTYDFNVAISAGFSGATPGDSISKVDSAFTDLCIKRGTSIYFVDGAEDMDAAYFYAYTGLPGTASEPDYTTTGFNTSYAAATGPWMISTLLSTGRQVSLPGSYAHLISWSNSISQGNNMWLAPAGVKRASLGSLVKSGSTYEVGSAILDMWQNHDILVDQATEHNINPIMRLKQYGYVIYGNSTLLQSRYDAYGTKSSSMLQSLSTRVVCNLIKSQAFNISLQLQFDQLSDDILLEFKTLMSTFMDQLRYGGALYDYEIVADSSVLTLDNLNTRTVPVTIRISPTPAAENFVINLEISQAGVTFGEDNSMEDNTIVE